MKWRNKKKPSNTMTWSVEINIFKLLITGLLKTYFVGIFQEVKKELQQISMLPLTHRWNQFVDVFQRIGKELLQMLLQLTDRITYNYLVRDMLNSTERITYRMKLVFFFSVYSVCKAIGKVINDELTENQKLPTRIFWIGVFCPWSCL